MLLVVALSCLVASTAGTIGRPIFFPGSTACTAPSGRSGDCVLPDDCPASHGPVSRRVCGIQRRQNMFCCEPQPRQISRPRPFHITFPTEPEPALPDDCGLSGTGAVLYIAGGRDAGRSSWPWAALLGTFERRQGSAEPEWICGGVLLGPRHVLTAAHCVATADRSQLVLRLGEHDLRAESSTRQERRVSRVLVHPNFRRRLADMALLVLDEPVTLRRGSVHPICLPQPSTNVEGRSGYVVGWGQLGFEGKQPDILQEALVTVTETEPCEDLNRRTREYRDRFPGGWRGSVLCAKDLKERGMDACGGDSGGPLSMLRSDGRYQLAGLVLEGMGCGSSTYPGLYTSVPHYVNWIRREVERS